VTENQRIRPERRRNKRHDHADSQNGAERIKIPTRTIIRRLKRETGKNVTVKVPVGQGSDSERAAEFRRPAEKNERDAPNGRSEDDSRADGRASRVRRTPAVAAAIREAGHCDETPRLREVENRGVARNPDVSEARGTAGPADRERSGRSGQNAVTHPTQEYRCVLASVWQDDVEPTVGAAPENQQSVKVVSLPPFAWIGSESSKTQCVQPIAR
jgi:hypothetical protein